MKHGAVLSMMLVLVACSAAKDNDQPVPPAANPLGTGHRLREVQDPSSPAYSPNKTVAVTSVVVTAIDNFDETHNGKSRGTVFVQDADLAAPYSGISLYSPTFVPANLRLAPGDVVDLNGQYVEEQTIGSTVNFAPDFLPQMSKPQVTQQFETQLPQPVVVQLSDLQSFATARPYIGMLVTLQDVTVAGAPAPTDTSGRVAAQVTPTGPYINNELMDLQPTTFAAGTHFKSITGIVDFFFNVFIAPRSTDDLVQ